MHVRIDILQIPRDLTPQCPNAALLQSSIVNGDVHFNFSRKRKLMLDCFVVVFACITKKSKPQTWARDNSDSRGTIPCERVRTRSESLFIYC